VLWRRFKLFLFFVLLIGLLGEVAFLYWREHQPKENPFDPIITSVARDNGVDPFLIRALIWRESRFNPLTHGTADERGLMQVTPEAGQIWAKANKIPNFTPDSLYDAETNVRAGTWYLNRSIRRWSQANVDDPIPFALAEYNAGRSNALKWVDPSSPQDHNAFMQRITYPGTRKYVEVILEKRDQYRDILAHNPWYRDYLAANPTTQTP
jgi:soluble lytic murein transglycosylase